MPARESSVLVVSSRNGQTNKPVVLRLPACPQVAALAAGCCAAAPQLGCLASHSGKHTRRHTPVAAAVGC